MDTEANNKETIEDIILRHSGRGMDVLRGYLDGQYCRKAAEALLARPKGNILLLTGFYVAGYAETDGPLGTYCLARALNLLGYHAEVVTDEYCRGFFECRQIDVVYVPVRENEADYPAILDACRPEALLSIERCGRNVQGDYANMRGVSIRSTTARLDRLFELAAERGILTIGVGDGGNEIGMGNLKEVISEKLSLVPCEIPADYLVIASVSNWGAYGITAYLGLLTGRDLLPAQEDCEAYLAYTVGLGSVDGVKRTRVCGVDGFPPETEWEILNALREVSA